MIRPSWRDWMESTCGTAWSTCSPQIPTWAIWIRLSPARADQRCDNFPCPSDALRRQIIESRWHAEMFRTLNLDRICVRPTGSALRNWRSCEAARPSLSGHPSLGLAACWSDFETGRRQTHRRGIGFLEAVRPVSSSVAVA